MTGKDRGKEGRILAVFPKNDRIIVEGVNLVKRHLKLRAARGRAGQEGGIITKEAPVHVSNVQIVCPSCGPTRVGLRDQGRNEDPRMPQVRRRDLR